MKTNDVNEAGSNRDAYQRDYDSSVSGMGRPADHRGLRQELAHETNNIAVYINGKLWKVWAGKGTADSREERAYLNSMQGWADKKSAATGKKWTVGLTGANVSEATSAAVRMQRAADKQRAKSDASLARTPSSIPKKEEPKQPIDQKGVAEAGYPEVDHMPGPTIKRTQTGCKRCHGKGYVYKTPDGEVHPTNQSDAKKYKCGKCNGIGFVKTEGVAEAEKNPHTSALGKALYRDLSKEMKASPAQVEKNKANWAKNPHNPANKEQGVAEGSQRVDSLVTDALKIMRGAEVGDAVLALKTVLGDREYNGRRGFYNFYVKQMIDMYSQQGMAEDINEGAEQMTPNWAKYVLDQLYNSDGAVTLTDLFDEGIPGLHDMFMATAEAHGLNTDDEFEDVEHELTLELEDLIKGGHGLDEASLAQMRDYFNQPDNNTVKVDNQYGAPERKTQAHVPPEIQMLINKMYRIGKITPQEFETLKNFQLKTKINVGLNIKEADKNPYAIGMAQAMKSTGDKPPLKKSTINKAHEIARAVKKDE